MFVTFTVDVWCLKSNVSCMSMCLVIHSFTEKDLEYIHITEEKEIFSLTFPSFPFFFKFISQYLHDMLRKLKPTEYQLLKTTVFFELKTIVFQL